MAVALKKVGFEVIAPKDVDKRSMEMAMAAFGRRAKEAEAALVYYAGPGIQYQGLNYLMPVDARLEDKYSVNYELTRIDDVLFALSNAPGVKILILDACRNNPLVERLSSPGTHRDLVQTRGQGGMCGHRIPQSFGGPGRAPLSAPGRCLPAGTRKLFSGGGFPAGLAGHLPEAGTGCASPRLPH